MSTNEELLQAITAGSEQDSSPNIPENLTVLPLRDVIIYPYMIFPVLIGRTSSLKAVSQALERDKFIFAATQTQASIDEPALIDVYPHGTICKILQVIRLPNNLLKVLVEGVFHGVIEKPIDNADCLEAHVRILKKDDIIQDAELEAYVRKTYEAFSAYVSTNKHLPPEIQSAFENIEDPVRKLFYAAANIDKNVHAKQEILQQTSLKMQYKQLLEMLKDELEVLKLEEELDTKVADSIQKTQRKYYIQEQIRALQKELDGDEELSPEMLTLLHGIESSGMPDVIKKRVLEEFDKFKKTMSMSPEYSVLRTYLETVIGLPWTNITDDSTDLRHVADILNEDHYNMEKPKERILEFISILKMAGTAKGQILCLSGPPGVGKTSLARSIARALGRSFVRISLGGIRDEAEIRGHRRTYIGAMPGKIISAMKKAGTVNPVILLDEVDKMSMDFRGDPSAALLEVLDPEQNNAFNDHYLELDYDLSKVLFITTANVKYNIPAPLLDRMEVIDLNSYLDFEKVQIAKKHIVPNLLQEYALKKFKISFSDKALLKIIREYTRESGVRNLEREIASILRKIAKEIVSGVQKSTGKGIKVSEDSIEHYLRTQRFKETNSNLTDKIGIATGLAWTSVGGDTLPVEVSIMPGTERLTLTGKLGDVMKESASAALTYIRSHVDNLSITPGFEKGKEIHIHVPEGAIPKDGPSAGITMTIAMISAATGKPVRGDIAMTGEITLRGMILPIGGLNEKLLAAKRLGIKTVLIPEGNAKDIQEVNSHILKGLNIIPVERLDQALPHAFRKWTATRSDSTPQKHDAQHQEKRKKKNISIAQSTSNKKKSGRVSRS
ncbi:MAG: endopeptidase La [Ignavibacteria bacterium]|nr:endopeptidase La [Ignavibacteria bacterium]